MIFIVEVFYLYTMKKILIIITAVAFFCFGIILSVFAEKVNESTARIIATNQAYPREIAPASITIGKPNGDVYYYVFKVLPSGFVLVSGEDNLAPVLGYSFENEFSGESPELNYIMKGFEEAIDSVRGKYYSEGSKSEWKLMLSGRLPSSRAATVGPLTKTKWGQEYNMYLPYDTKYNAPCLSGCIATMQAQLMYYWQWPVVGKGSYGYNCNLQTGCKGDFGYLFADFTDAKYYRYADMKQMQTRADSACYALQYAVGVSNELGYGTQVTGGTGGYLKNEYYRYCVENSLIQNFRYDPKLKSVDQKNYTWADWFNLVKTELDAGRLVPYASYDSISGGYFGHAFLFDGYDGSGNVSVNWGWSGAGNGFFRLSSLDVYYYKFNLNSHMLIGVQPDSFCPKTTGTACVYTVGGDCAGVTGDSINAEGLESPTMALITVDSLAGYTYTINNTPIHAIGRCSTSGNRVNVLIDGLENKSYQWVLKSNCGDSIILETNPSSFGYKWADLTEVQNDTNLKPIYFDLLGRELDRPIGLCIRQIGYIRRLISAQ